MEILIASQHTENFNTKLAVQAALLHDVVEDTKTTKEELQEMYGEEVTNAVSALTKNTVLPKEEKCLNYDSDDQSNHTNHSSDNPGWRSPPAT